MAKDNSLSCKESEIKDVMQFLKFSIDPKAPFKGTIGFHFEDPEADPCTYSITTSPKEKLVVTKRYEDEEEISKDAKSWNCRVSISMDDFLYIYSGKASGRDIASMCYNGKVKVHGYRFRSIQQFAASFDFSTEKWNAFYRHLENKDKVTPAVSSIEFPKPETVWSQEQEQELWRMLRTPLVPEPRGLRRRSSSSSASDFTTSAWQRNVSLIQNQFMPSSSAIRVEPPSVSLGDIDAGLASILIPQQMNSAAASPRKSERYSHNYQRRPFDTLSTLVRRHSTGNVKKQNSSGYISVYALALREVKLQTEKLLHRTMSRERVHRVIETPPVKVPWILNGPEVDNPSMVSQKRTYGLRKTMYSNIRHELRKGHRAFQQNLNLLGRTNNNSRPEAPFELDSRQCQMLLEL